MRYLQTLALCAISSVVLSACGKPAGPPEQPPPAVSVAIPLRQTVTDWDDFTGRFQAQQTVEVRARAGGYLQAVHFRDGQQVKKGQLLFTLDPRPAQALLAAAKAQSEVARSELRRSETLLAAQAISREEFEARSSAALVADSALRARQLDVEFTRVTAPISGVVSDRRVDAGNVIAGGSSTGDVLTTVVSTNPIHFVFDASEAQLLKYQRQAGSRGGAPVRIRLQDETEPRWTGRVDFLDNAVDPASGALRLRAVVANPGGFLKPGMFGNARVEGGAAYAAMLVPEDAIVADGPRKVVYVVPASGATAGEVQVRPIETGPSVNGLRVIRSGLRADDRVIINGVQRVRPGIKVQARLVKAAAPAKVAGAGVSAPSETAPASTATSAN